VVPPKLAQAVAPFTCTSFVSVTPTLRLNSLTEQIGDVLLICNGGTPTPTNVPIPQVTLTVSPNTTLTNRLLGGSFLDALLLIDEPPPANQAICGAPGYPETSPGVCSITGIGLGIGAYVGSPGRPNIFQGKQIGNAVTWQFPLDPSGVNPRYLRITNLRVNASAVPPGTGGGAGSVKLSTTLTASPTITVSNPSPTVGFVQPGMNVTLRDVVSPTLLTSPVSLPQCQSRNLAPPFTSNFKLRFEEAFGTAWKVRTETPFVNDDTSPNPAAQNELGTLYNSETGVFSPTFPSISGRGNLGLAGLADYGTRVKVVFNNVPAGVKLYVPPLITTTLTVLRQTANETGAFFPVPASTGGLSEVSISGGSGAAVWEVLKTNPNTAEIADIPVSVAFTGNPALPSPQVGTATVKGSFAPTSAVAAPSALDPVPRFMDDASTLAAFTIAPCPVTGVALSGPTSGQAQTAYQFTAMAGPVSATQQITYVWQASSQATITHTNGLSDTQTYSWPASGSQLVAVSAQNGSGTVLTTQNISLAEPPPKLVFVPMNFSIYESSW
jgi:hypothetical protein